MTADRGRSAETILNGAIALTGDARAKYVLDACKGDTALQAEVESLLAHPQSVESVHESPSLRPSLQGLQHSRYEILEPIGRGGMGEVYKARDGQLGRVVAVKAVRPEHGLSAEVAKRLGREARVGASLDHPFICKVHELIQLESGETLLVMEFVEGQTLKQLLKNGPLTASRAAKLCGEIAEAVGFAHTNGVIHRDLKPANVMVTSQHVKVMDFGIARQHHATAETVTDLTAGRVVGTPAYMSPEQASGRPLDQRSDIYSFGVLLYECLTATLPAEDLAIRWPTANTIAVSADLRAVIDRCLEREREKRFDSFREIQTSLERAAALLTPAVSARPLWKTRRFVFEVSALIAVTAAGWAYTAWRAAQAGPTLVMLSQEPIVTWATAEFGSRVSPDGTTVSFISSQDGRQRIWMRSVKATAGSEPRPITEPTDEIRTPIWSDDGKKIAYLYKSNDKPWLRIISTFGESAGTDQLIDANWRDIALVRWIGNHIYFSRTAGSSRGRLWLYATDSRSVVEVTHKDGAIFQSSGGIVSVDVRPDERQLILIRAGGDADALAISDIDGRNSKDIAADIGRALAPRWRDGRDIVFISNKNGQFDIWELNLSTGTRKQVTTSALEETNIDVSAAGGAMVADTITEVSHLWSANLTPPLMARQLTNDGRSDSCVTANNDGDLVFQRSKGAFQAFGAFDANLVSGRWAKDTLDAEANVDSGFWADVAPSGKRVLYFRQAEAPFAELWVRALGQAAAPEKIWDRFSLPNVNIATWSPSTRNAAWSPRNPTEFFFVGQSDSSKSDKVLKVGIRNDSKADVRILAQSATADERIVDLAPTPDGRNVAFVRTVVGQTHRDSIEMVGEEGVVRILWVPLDKQVRLLGWRDNSLMVAFTGPDGTSRIEGLERNGHRTSFAEMSGAVAATFRLLPDGNHVLATTCGAGRCQIVSVSLSTGTTSPLVTAEREGLSYGSFAIPGNGRFLYAAKETTRDVWSFTFGSEFPK